MRASARAAAAGGASMCASDLTIGRGPQPAIAKAIATNGAPAKNRMQEYP
jgi:hypothetical protein